MDFALDNSFDFQDSDTKSVSSFVATSIAAVALTIGATAINVNKVSVSTPNTSQTSIVRLKDNSEAHLTSPNMVSINQSAGQNLNVKIAGDILKVREELGLSNVKLAKILNVSRESVQKWVSKPSTEPQQETLVRANALSDFSDAMKPVHRKFLGKLTTGILEIEELTAALESNDLNSESLTSLYNKYYLKFDGAYKRSLM